MESRHRGSVAVLAADGSAVVRVGSVESPIFPRSANKPFQALAMLRSGLGLSGELLALAAASHSGEDFHVDGVSQILASAGVSADALQCPAAWPMDDETAYRLIAAGEAKSRLRMNCSGKHAAMLATCAVAGWPLESYLAVDHPLQVAIRSTVEELAGEKVAATGIDGCGAPLFAISLIGVARAFRNLALAKPDSPAHRIAEAMRSFPAWTSGTRRDERRLMDAVPGLLVKCGAEGVDAFVFEDGRACVVKIDDGAMRARVPVTVAALRLLGASGDVLDSLAVGRLHGGDGVVGEIRAVRPSPGDLHQGAARN